MRVVNKVKVTCKFGKNDVRTVKFVATDKRVRASCKGKPPILVKPHESDSGALSFIARVKIDGTYEYIAARSAERAYKKAVKHAWK